MTVEDLHEHRARRNGKAWVPPHVIEAEAFIGKRAPKRQYLDDSKLLPLRQVVLFGGDGGTGKSLVALQLALACSSVLPYWLGMQVKTGPVIYLSAEDDEDEIHKRIEEICEAEGADLELVRGNLSIICMASEEMSAVLATERAKGVLAPTALYQWLDVLMQDRSPMLLILDNQADVYGANENDRTLVKQFVNLLRRLAIKHDCLILLLGHPSQSGRSSGTGESGSTGWNNSVRVRLYLHRVTNENGHEPDEDVRVLEVMKSNYSRKGRKIQLRWDGGRFVADSSAGSSYLDGVPPRFYEQVQAAFAEQWYRCEAQSPQWGGFKVAEMLDRDVGVGLTKKQCNSDQREARDNTARLLSSMVASKAIVTVRRAGSDRHEYDFYAPGPTA